MARHLRSRHRTLLYSQCQGRPLRQRARRIHSQRQLQSVRRRMAHLRDRAHRQRIHPPSGRQCRQELSRARLHRSGSCRNPCDNRIHTGEITPYSRHSGFFSPMASRSRPFMAGSSSSFRS